MERDIREFYRRTWFIAHLALACAICVGYITGARCAGAVYRAGLHQLRYHDCFGSITTGNRNHYSTTTTTLAPPPTTSPSLPVARRR